MQGTASASVSAVADNTVSAVTGNTQSAFAGNTESAVAGSGASDAMDMGTVRQAMARVAEVTHQGILNVHPEF